MVAPMYRPVPFLICLLLAATFGRLAAQAPQPGLDSASKGVRCPIGFDAVFDPVSKVLRCRKESVRWVVTSCKDKEFASYLTKPGADACAPTEIPGVGTPPGAKGTRAVDCAAPGYELIVDRTGLRDRCERTDRVFALPQPVG